MFGLFCRHCRAKNKTLKMAGIPLQFYLYLSAFLFCLGFLVVITRRNVIVVLMGIELMLNAGNINLIAFSYMDSTALQGQIFTLFTIIVAAAEAGVALALILKVFSHFRTTNLDEYNSLNG